jgi:hypothetical protein
MWPGSAQPQGPSQARPPLSTEDLVREALNSGGAHEAFQGVYELVNRAVAEDDNERARALVRTELPALVDQFERSYPIVRSRVRGLKLRTQAFRADLAAGSRSSRRPYVGQIGTTHSHRAPTVAWRRSYEA